MNIDKTAIKNQLHDILSLYQHRDVWHTAAKLLTNAKLIDNNVCIDEVFYSLLRYAGFVASQSSPIKYKDNFLIFVDSLNKNKVYIDPQDYNKRHEYLITVFNILNNNHETLIELQENLIRE